MKDIAHGLTIRSDPGRSHDEAILRFGNARARPSRSTCSSSRKTAYAPIITHCMSASTIDHSIAR